MRFLANWLEEFLKMQKSLNYLVEEEEISGSEAWNEVVPLGLSGWRALSLVAVA